MNLKLISCEVFCREMQFVISQSANHIETEFHSKGLHDVGSKKMREKLQDSVDQTNQEAFDAILLGYGLCNNGLHHVTARGVPLVVPRAHDCSAWWTGSGNEMIS